MSTPKESEQNTSMSVGSFNTIKWRCTIDGEEYVSTIVVTKHGCPLIHAVDLIKMLSGKPDKMENKSARRHFDYIRTKCTKLNVCGQLEVLGHDGLKVIQLAAYLVFVLFLSF